MLKKDWSVTRITILLYVIVLFIPLNYYFAKQSFDSIHSDTKTMNHLVFVSSALSSLKEINNFNKKQLIIKEIDESFYIIEKALNNPSNEEYKNLFYADESYNLLKLSYENLKVAINNNNSITASINKILQEVNSFSITAQNVTDYKIDAILDRLYISLALTMISIVLLVSFIRLYIKLQLLKHTVHDHTTGLYNKKYFDNALHDIELLETRQEKPLSLLIVSITNYTKLKDSLDNKGFEYQLKEFAKIFKHFFRQSDIVCRIKEGCFASITPDASSENIDKIATKLKSELRAKLVNSSIKLEISIGVATYDKESSMSLLQNAEKNMQNSGSL